MSILRPISHNGCILHDKSTASKPRTGIPLGVGVRFPTRGLMLGWGCGFPLVFGWSFCLKFSVFLGCPFPGLLSRGKQAFLVCAHWHSVLLTSPECSPAYMRQKETQGYDISSPEVPSRLPSPLHPSESYVCCIYNVQRWDFSCLVRWMGRRVSTLRCSKTRSFPDSLFYT